MERYQYHYAHLIPDKILEQTLNEMGHGGWHVVPGTWDRLPSGYSSFLLETTVTY